MTKLLLFTTGYAFCPAPWKAGSTSFIDTDIVLTHKFYIQNSKDLKSRLENHGGKYANQISELLQKSNASKESADIRKFPSITFSSRAPMQMESPGVLDS
ncbi:serine carboxypeptidase-like 34 [Striga asiatica]|uniref:Serine carboxypeptidase-like 34 n=1 Tax=Striga asiatica TaxID=4170 RepID=A0A5A7R9W3_STRAF|nr:serine carboxypeptidase-like 34 [Striga asiatica]